MRGLSGWLLLALMGCGASFPALKLRELPGAEEHPGAKLLLLLDETEVEYGPGGKDGGPQARETRRVRWRVLRPTEMAPVLAWYSVGFAEIERIAGRVIGPDGRETSLETSKQSDRAAFGSSVLFSDSRVVVVPVPPLPVGSVFEHEVVVRHFDPKPLVTHHIFGDEHPTEVSRVVASAPVQWEMRFQEAHADGLLPAETVEGGRRRWVFERRKLPGYEAEESGVPLWAVAPQVAVRLEAWTKAGATERAFANPRELSRWLSQQYAQRAVRTPDLVETVRQVLLGVTEPEAQARALYEYACRRIQYCAIEIGYGGWIPHAASDVHKAQYGDCKDKANYLRTMLDVAGIPSSPTLIYAHRGVPRPFLLPSLGANFNHAILAVHLPSGTVYADPTHRAVPFGELPPGDSGAPVLELSPAGEELKRTPETNPERNVETVRLELTLDDLGHAAGRFTVFARGANASSYKNKVLFGTGSLDDHMKDRLPLRSVEPRDVKVEEAGDFGPEVRIAGRLLTRNLVSRGEGVALLRPSDVLTLSAQRLKTPRRTDVVFRAHETEETDLALALPPGLSATHLPAPVELASPFGRFRLGWRQEGGTLHLSRQFVRLKRIIPPGELKAANRFFEAIAAAETAPAVLRQVRPEGR